MVSQIRARGLEIKPDDVYVGPSDYVPWQKDNKLCFLRIESRHFGDVPMNLECRLSVEDSPNSAGVVIDAIRCAKVALDRGIGGALEGPSAYFMKTPPKQYPDTVGPGDGRAFRRAAAGTPPRRRPAGGAPGSARRSRRSGGRPASPARRMRILLTNDDGIHAPGLEALWRAVRDLGEVTVVAPDSERSAVGHAITLADPLRVSAYDGPRGLTGHAVSGTPADCVKIARARHPRAAPPTSCSRGSTRGRTSAPTCSTPGTVSAATEAAMLGIPAAAFSLADWRYDDFSAAAAFARRLAGEIGRRGLPRGVSLNVNVPPLPAGEIRGDG